MIRTIAAAVAAALMLGGCARTSVGVAARVGDTRIETSTVAARVTRAYRDPTFAQQQPQADYQRALLNRMIAIRLVEIAARRRNVKVAESAVGEQVKAFEQQAGSREALERQAASQGIPKEDLRAAIRDRMLQDALQDDLVKDVNVTEAQLRAEYQRQLPVLDVARIAHIIIRDDKKAAAVAALAKRPGADFAALAKQHSDDQVTAQQGGDLGQLGNGEGKFERAFEQAVFKAKAGEVVGPIKTRIGYEIVKVTDRRTRSFADARDDLRRSVVNRPREERFEKLLSDLAAELGVSVNPRFGRWDPKTGVLIAGDPNVLSSPAPVPGAEQPPGGPPPGGAPPGGAPPGGAPPGGAPPGGPPPGGPPPGSGP